MARRIVLVFASIILSLLSFAQINNTFNLMPLPAVLKVNANKIKITKQFGLAIIGITHPRIYAEASRFIRRLSNKTGIFLDKQEYMTPGDSNRSAQILIKILR